MKKVKALAFLLPLLGLASVPLAGHPFDDLKAHKEALEKLQAGDRPGMAAIALASGNFMDTACNLEELMEILIHLTSTLDAFTHRDAIIPWLNRLCSVMDKLLGRAAQGPRGRGFCVEFIRLQQSMMALPEVVIEGTWRPDLVAQHFEPFVDLAVRYLLNGPLDASLVDLEGAFQEFMGHLRPSELEEPTYTRADRRILDPEIFGSHVRLVERSWGLGL